MKIIIQKTARVYIEANSQDKTITVSNGTHPGGSWTGSCGPTPRYPSVRLGVPDDNEIYEKIIIDGITVCFQPSLADFFSSVSVVFGKFLAARGTRKTGMV